MRRLLPLTISLFFPPYCVQNVGVLYVPSLTFSLFPSPPSHSTPLGSSPASFASYASSSTSTTPHRRRGRGGGLDSSSTSSSSSSSLLLPNKRSAYVGAFRHAPPSRGFKDLGWEPAFTTGRPSLTQMDLARQERFRTRHVEPQELLQLPMSMYNDLMQRRRRARLEMEAGLAAGALGEDIDEEAFFVFEEEEGGEEGGGGGGGGGEVGACLLSDNDDDELREHTHLCVICLEGFTPWDMVRELPECKHIHHQRCLDVWLRGAASYEACHTRSCPTCKTPITFPPPVAANDAAVEVQDDKEKEAEDSSGLGGFMSSIIPRWAYVAVAKQQAASSSV